MNNIYDVGTQPTLRISFRTRFFRFSEKSVYKYDIWGIGARSFLVTIKPKNAAH